MSSELLWQFIAISVLSTVGGMSRSPLVYLPLGFITGVLIARWS